MILSICDLPDVLAVMRIVKIVITIIKVVVPILLIISAMIDFARAVSDAELNKITKPMVNKVIAAVLVFLIPTFVKLIAQITLNDSEYEACLGDITIDTITTAQANQIEVIIKKAEDNPTESNYNQALQYLSQIEDESKRKEFESRLNEVKNKIEETKVLKIESITIKDVVVQIKVNPGNKKVTGYYLSSIKKTPEANGYDWIDTNETDFKVTKYPGKYYIYVKDDRGKITGGDEVNVPKVFDVTLKHQGKKMMPVSISTYLNKHNSSLDAFNKKISSYNKKHTYRTRESVVVGAMAFTSEVQSWGYYMPYSGSNETIDKDHWGVYKYWGGGEKTFLACNPFVVWAFKQAGLNIYGNRSKIKHDYCNTPRINGKGQTEYEKLVSPQNYSSKVHVYYYFVGPLGSKNTYADNIIDRHKGRSGDILQSHPTSGHEMLIVDKYDDDMDGISDGYIVLQSRDIGLCYEKIKYGSTTVFDMSNVYNNTASFSTHLNGWQQYYIPESDYPVWMK